MLWAATEVPPPFADRSVSSAAARISTLLAVFRSRELHEGLKRFPARSTYRVMHPGLKGYWQFFGRVDADGEFFFHAPVPADTTKENYDFHGLLQKAAGFTFACEFDYVGFWDLRISVADTYQVGRAFIAGDAAHSHPPYGAYGLNSGLDDVANLGWKLAAKLQGWGSDARYCCRTAKSDVRFSRRPRKISLQPEFMQTGNSSTATAQNGIARNSSMPGRNTRLLLLHAC
jgi:hypothetical protein